MQKICIIADVGRNHNGEMGRMLELVKKAKESGADYVRIHRKTPELCIQKSMWNEEYVGPNGKRDKLLDIVRSLEFNEEAIDKICSECGRIDIKPCFAVWDVESVNSIKKYGSLFTRVPGPQNNNIDLLEKVCEASKSICLSTSMSTLGDVEAMLDSLNMARSVYLMHSVAQFPTDPQNSRIHRIEMLKAFSVYDNYGGVGFESHETGFYQILAATGKGLSVVEKHITLEGKILGIEDSYSLKPRGFKQMVSAIREVEQGLYENENDTLGLVGSFEYPKTGW